MYDYLVVGSACLDRFCTTGNRSGKKVLADRQASILREMYTEKVEGINFTNMARTFFTPILRSVELCEPFCNI